MSFSSATRHLTRSCTAVAVCLMTACAPVPVAGPPLAVSGGGPNIGRGSSGGDSPNNATESRDPLQNLPTLDPSMEMGRCLYLESGPPMGVERDCTSFAGTGTIEDLGLELYMAVLRTDTADLSQPPIVVAAGADRSFESVTAQWSRALVNGLDHPVVVVEPRTAVMDDTTCDPEVSAVADELAGNRDESTSRETRTLTSELSRGCQDPLGDHYLEFGAQDIAADFAFALDALGLDRAIIGAAGSGIRAVTAFGTAHPERMAALVVDSPTPLSPRLDDAISLRAEGAQRALETWLAQCRSTTCIDTPLPDSPPVIDDARASVQLAGALRTVSDELAAVYRADTEPNLEFLQPAIAALTSSGSVRGTWPARNLPAAFYDLCSDYSVRPALDTVADVIKKMQENNPTFGADQGYRMLSCADWPVAERTTPHLPEVDALVLGSTGGDPLAGTDPAGLGAAELTNAGARNAVPLRWGGFGSTAIGRNECVAAAVNTFLQNPSAAAPSACPA